MQQKNEIFFPAAAPPAASAPSPSQAAKPGDKRKSSRPPAGGPASKTPGPASKSAGPASKTSTPAPGPGPKERKASFHVSLFKLTRKCPAGERGTGATSEI